jgi:hypothetical protein
MTDASLKAAALLREHRESIDRLDAILVYTLGERFKHTQAVGRLKAEPDLPPADPVRDEAHRPCAPGRSRPGFRQEIPGLHHPGSHQAPRKVQGMTAAPHPSHARPKEIPTWP